MDEKYLKFLESDMYGNAHDLQMVIKNWQYALPHKAVEFNYHFEVIRALQYAGSHFYSHDAVKYFKAKTSDPMLKLGRFWIESKKFMDNPRVYQVAWISDDEPVDSDGIRLTRGYSVNRSSREYATLAAARKARDTLAAFVASELESEQG